MPQVLSKPPPTSAPKQAADYQAEAMAAFAQADKGDKTQTTTAPAETGSPSGASAKDDGGATGSPSEKEDPSATKPEKKAEDSNIPPNIKAAFEKLTTEKAAFRQQKDALTQQVKEANERAAKAEALLSAKTPMELLRARGFTWKDAAEEMTGVRPGGDEEEAPAAKPKADKKLSLEDIDPEVAADLKAWKAERAETARKAGREAISKNMTEFAEKEGKYVYTLKLGKIDEALDFIEQHFAKYKELPGSTPRESMEIALAHVEESLKSQAEKWKAVLTPASDDATDQGAAENRESAAPDKAASEQAGSKTLTHSQAGAPRTGPSKTPSTPEEYRAAALAALLKAEKSR